MQHSLREGKYLKHSDWKALREETLGRFRNIRRYTKLDVTEVVCEVLDWIGLN
jgi:hypothetical protein